MKFWTVYRPVGWVRRFWPRDVQQDPPRAWCPACGAEVWERTCSHCGTETG